MYSLDILKPCHIRLHLKDKNRWIKNFGPKLEIIDTITNLLVTVIVKIDLPSLSLMLAPRQAMIQLISKVLNKLIAFVVCIFSKKQSKR